MRLLAASSLVFVLLATVAAAQPSPSPANVPGEAVFAVSGRGWGHGVGMSQYGAFGQAKEGKTYDEILAYYYFGTKLGRAGRKEVRVLLAEGRRAVSIFSPAPFRAVDAAGTVVKLPAGAVTLTPQLLLPGTAAPAKGPLVVRPGKAAVSLDGRAYRGRFELVAQGGFLRVVNHVGLEEYIQGVVADEMPHTWPLEALKAQAVAARSYALKSIVKGKPFDLYADVRSQVYGGIAAEEPTSTAAVRATAGRVVTYDGQIATTYYFSTSGGKTANAEDVFGAAVPYLISRPDPWDKVSPLHRWGPLLLGARTVQAKFGAGSRVLDITSVETPSGRLRSLTLHTVAGSTSVPPSVARSTLGLRSTWITVGVLRLDRPRGTVEYGTPLRLTGIARNISSPQLAASATGATWTPLGALVRAADGSVSRSLEPAKTTHYRIEGSGPTVPGAGQETEPLRSQVLLVRVAPRVRLAKPVQPGVLSGTVRPRLSGAIAHVERQRGSMWVHVGEVLVGDSGTFRVEAAVVPGTYRARVTAGGGFAEGVSPVLTVDG